MKFHLTKAEIQQQFHLPLEEAAKALGICASVLKKTCRHHGIKRWPYRKIRSLNKKKVSLEQSVKTFYNQYHKMKSQLDQVNKERKDILLKETGWDSLAEEEQEDHPAFHTLEQASESSFSHADSEDDDDFEKEFDEEDEEEDVQTPPQQTPYQPQQPIVGPSQTISPLPRSEHTPQIIPFTTNLWSSYSQPEQRQQTVVSQGNLVQRDNSPVMPAFKIPSIMDLLASVDNQVQKTQNQYAPQQQLPSLQAVSNFYSTQRSNK